MRECGAAQISVPFAEESFDPGDMLLINGAHLTLPGFGVAQENKKLRLAWIVRGRRDVLLDPLEERGGSKNVMMLLSSPQLHLCSPSLGE